MWPWLVYDETPTNATLVGGAIILAAVGRLTVRVELRASTSTSPAADPPLAVVEAVTGQWLVGSRRTARRRRHEETMPPRGVPRWGPSRADRFVADERSPGDRHGCDDGGRDRGEDHRLDEDPDVKALADITMSGSRGTIMAAHAQAAPCAPYALISTALATTFMIRLPAL